MKNGLNSIELRRVFKMNKKFKNVLNGIAQPVPPIWFMRQAGRYHSHYQELRKRYSFEQLCKTPELATEVACGPIDDFDYDVAILFSDILFPLELMGLNLTFDPGPKFSHFLNEVHEKNYISEEKVEQYFSFQAKAIALTKDALPKDKSLVGFVGGPWTVLSYGLGMKDRLSVNRSAIQPFMEKLLYEQLIPILRKNIEIQFKAGAEIVYIFDTNSKQLGNVYFLEKYIPELRNELFSVFENRLAYFSKNQSFYDQPITEINNLNLAGVVFSANSGFEDFLKPQKNFFVQGNFNPLSLLKSHSEYCIDFDHFLNNIKKLNNAERKGWICSLSHGVLPKTPEQNVHHFIDAIRTKFSTSS